MQDLTGKYIESEMNVGQGRVLGVEEGLTHSKRFLFATTNRKGHSK